MADPVVRIMCPNLNCRRILAVPPQARDKTVRCIGCGAYVHVPAAPPPKSPTAPKSS